MNKFIHEKGVCWIDRTKVTGIEYWESTPNMMKLSVKNYRNDYDNQLKVVEAYLPYGTLPMYYKTEVDRYNARVKLVGEDK